MKVLMLVDEETVAPEDPQLVAAISPTTPVMEHHVATGLREAGHTVNLLPFGQDLVQTIESIRSQQPNVIFNLTEWVQGDRRKDAHVASLLDLLEIPYTGTGPIGLTLCRDKAMCKRILGHHRVRSPHFFLVPPGTRKLIGRRRYPAIVKPLFEDGSDGISMASLVHTDAELWERVRLIHEQRNQPAICEEFIPGREIYVGVIGNERLRAFPPREVRFGRTQDGGPSIATAKVKWDEAYRKKWAVEYTFAELTPDLERKIIRISKRIYRHLQIRDYGRIDLRVTDAGEVVFLEANPNPNIARDEDLAEAATKANLPYPHLLDRILRLSLKRK